MNSPIKGVCVGAGYFSRFQYESWQRIPEVSIVANCNRSVGKAEDIAKDYGIHRSYPVSEFGEMIDLEKPDFVDIITPPETHLDLCRIAVKKGVHIICQKPLAPTWDETVELVELIRTAKGRFMVHENFRWQPWYREIRKVLDAGTLGEFFHLAFRCRMGDGWGEDAYLARQPFFRDYKRLFLFETGVHFLDTFRYLAGEIDSIHALIARRNPLIKGEDSALVTCRFANGGTAVLDANRYNEVDSENPRYTFGTLRIDGSQGHLEMDLDGRITIKPLGEPSYEHAYTPSKDNFAGDCVHALQQHFVDCMLHEKPFESTVDDYLKSVRLVEAAYQSAAINQVVNTNL